MNTVLWVQHTKYDCELGTKDLSNLLNQSLLPSSSTCYYAISRIRPPPPPPPPTPSGLWTFATRLTSDDPSPCPISQMIILNEVWSGASVNVWWARNGMMVPAARTVSTPSVVCNRHISPPLHTDWKCYVLIKDSMHHLCNMTFHFPCQGIILGMYNNIYPALT